MKFGVGVLGATGYIGTPYRKEMRACGADARIVALSARRQDLLAAAAQEDGAVAVGDDWRAVVEHPEVDTVLVATPDVLHYEPVLAAARLKKHLICEKPLAQHAAHAREMWNAVREAGVGHFVPFWTRYVPAVIRLQELVRQGTIGDVRGVVLRWHNPRPLAMPFTWRDDATVSSAGSVADVGSHVYDTLRWLLGVEATRVLAHGAVVAPAKPALGEINLEEALRWGQEHPQQAAAQQSTRRGTAFDYACVSFELSGGAVGMMLLSHAPFIAKGIAPEIELHGALGSLAVHRPTSTITIAPLGESPRLLETVPDSGPGNRFAQHVFPALRERAAGQASDHPGMDDGYRVQLFTDAASESAKRGAWVELKEIEGK